MKFTAAESRYVESSRLYSHRYDNSLYSAATRYMNADPNRNAPRQYARSQRLIDAALALCGSPYHRINPDARWTAAEIAFLNLFI